MEEMIKTVASEIVVEEEVIKEIREEEDADREDEDVEEEVEAVVAINTEKARKREIDVFYF